MMLDAQLFRYRVLQRTSFLNFNGSFRDLCTADYFSSALFYTSIYVSVLSMIFHNILFSRTCLHTYLYSYG
jgi:hypothetical protein